MNSINHRMNCKQTCLRLFNLEIINELYSCFMIYVNNDMEIFAHCTTIVFEENKAKLNLNYPSLYLAK